MITILSCVCWAINFLCRDIISGWALLVDTKLISFTVYETHSYLYPINIFILLENYAFETQEENFNRFPKWSRSIRALWPIFRPNCQAVLNSGATCKKYSVKATTSLENMSKPGMWNSMSKDIKRVFFVFVL